MAVKHNIWLCRTFEKKLNLALFLLAEIWLLYMKESNICICGPNKWQHWMISHALETVSRDYSTVTSSENNDMSVVWNKLAIYLWKLRTGMHMIVLLLSIQELGVDCDFSSQVKLTYIDRFGSSTT